MAESEHTADSEVQTIPIDDYNLACCALAQANDLLRELLEREGCTSLEAVDVALLTRVQQLSRVATDVMLNEVDEDRADDVARVIRRGGI